MLAGRAESGKRENSSALWPGLRSRLDEIDGVRRPRRSWVPAGAMIAASVAIATMLLNQSTSSLPEIRGGDRSTVVHISPRVSAVDAVDDDRRPPANSRNLDNDGRPVHSFYLLEGSVPAGVTDQEF